MSPDKVPSRKSYPVDKEEKKRSLGAWIFIIIGVLVISVLIMIAPKEKPMVCDNAVRGPNSLTSFGSCHEE